MTQENKKNGERSLWPYLVMFAIAMLTGFAFFSYFDNQKIVTEKEEIFSRSKTTQKKLAPLRIGYITDAHCYSKINKENGKWEPNWRCKDPLNAFARQMNEEFKPNFVIEGGDLTDGRDDRPFESFLLAKELYEQVDAPKYHVLGNHEADNFPKEKWLETVGYKKAYYSFDVDGYRIFVLDGNYKPSTEEDPRPVGPDENKYYQGFIDQKQLRWLEKLLQKSNDFVKIVFVHQPPIDDAVGRNESEMMFNAKEVRAIFSKYQVRAVFSGHIEEFCALEADGVDYYVLQGFYKDNRRLEAHQRFKDAGVFSEVIITNDESKVKVYYVEERDGTLVSMSLNQETAVCNNSSVKIKEKSE
ncbi:MAG: metallophosphoesterase [Patescibacteria group bacterium]|nr:metallophosphoesterase [Patescibacteria group bacterium]